jgi:hypothetical protein
MHAVNGFLINQFQQGRSNQRMERYGGPVTNRLLLPVQSHGRGVSLDSLRFASVFSAAPTRLHSERFGELRCVLFRPLRREHYKGSLKYVVFGLQLPNFPAEIFKLGFDVFGDFRGIGFRIPRVIATRNAIAVELLHP